MAPTPKPNIDHKPARKGGLVPRSPAVTSKAAQPAGKPHQQHGPATKPRARKSPLKDEVYRTVFQGVDRWIAAGRVGDVMNFVCAAITKRLHGVRINPFQADIMIAPLPIGSRYEKQFDGNVWTVNLFLPNADGDGDGEPINFGAIGPGSFGTERLVGRLYTKWLKAKNAKGQCEATPRQPSSHHDQSNHPGEERE